MELLNMERTTDDSYLFIILMLFAVLIVFSLRAMVIDHCRRVHARKLKKGSEHEKRLRGKS